MRLTCAVILFCFALQSAFAELDYKQLAATKRDQPSSVTVIEGIAIPIPYGTVEIPKGATVKVTAYKPDGTLDIEYNGQKCSIAASKTDLEERVAAIRSKRIVIDGVEYVDFEFSNPTTTEVTLKHRGGIAKIPLAKLPTDLQQKFGYDPQKAAELQKTEQQAAERAAQLKRLKQLRRIKNVIYDFSPVLSAVTEAERLETQWRKEYDAGSPDREKTAQLERQAKVVLLSYDEYLFVGKVVQVLEDGLLVSIRPVSDSHELGQPVLTFLKNYKGQKSVVDGERVIGMGMEIGRHTYTDVQGANRTVPLFDCGEPVKESELTGEIVLVPPRTK